MKAIKWTLSIITVCILLFFMLESRTVTDPQVDFMENRLKQIEGLIIHRDALRPEVSAVDVAWHLDHVLKVIINITTTLERSDPATFDSNVNLARTVMFAYGDFPRGVAKAPESVTPPPVIAEAAIIEQLKLARSMVSKLHTFPKGANMTHDTFGQLDRDHTARLLEVHTDHHLRIIEDILATQ